MKRKISLFLAILMIVSLCSCGSTSADTSAEPASESSDEASAAPVNNDAAESEEPEQEDGVPDAEVSADDGASINIAVLAGPTGIGSVSLMEANDEGETVNSYNFTVVSANDDIVAGLASGEFDMAAVATNVAANLYQKMSGGVQICALNTGSVLYILENGDSIQSLSDLKGRTIYATGQGANPEYLLEYLLSENNLSWSTDGSDADVSLEFMESDALVSGAASGSYDVVMLPVPAVTAVEAQNSDMRTAINLSDEWDALNLDGQITMGCIVVNTEFASDNPDAVNAFLAEYKASIESVMSDPAHAGELCETYGIVAKAAIATKAIPDCALCFVSGNDIQPTIEPYYSVLYDANPASIGSSIPDEAFYYIGG